MTDEAFTPSGRALVAGVAGLIGSSLALRLLEDGWSVVGVDNLTTGQPSNIRELEQRSAFRFLRHDVTDLLEVDGQFDWIVHLASPASPTYYREHELATLRANAVGTENLLRLARRCGATFLFASSSEVYGEPLVHPQPEGYRGNVSPIGPRSAYDEGKRYGEAMAAAFRRSHGTPVRIARIFNTYGPRMDVHDGRLIPTLLRQALTGQDLTIHGTGGQTRSFQYVDDLVESLIRLLRYDYSEPVNLGSTEEHSVLDVAQLIVEMANSQSRLVFMPRPLDDPSRRRADISLATSLLQWSPAVSLRHGLSLMTEIWSARLGNDQSACSPSS
jgi:nucleoside-diphosphate-sugar epimerase